MAVTCTVLQPRTISEEAEERTACIILRRMDQDKATANFHPMHTETQDEDDKSYFMKQAKNDLLSVMRM